MSDRRAAQVVLLLIVLVIPSLLRADTLYLTHDEKMEGRILHIERTADGIAYIRISTQGAIIDVPGSMIARYEDVLEPTDTPTVTPTSTFTPRPTPTPQPPTPTPEPATPLPMIDTGVSGGAPSPTPPRWIGDSDGTGEGDFTGFGDGQGEPGWPDEGGGIGGGFNPGGLIEAYSHLQGPAQILSWIALILFVVGWIICVIDGFNQGAGTGVLLLIFGSPCCGCCFLNYSVLLTYSFKNYTGDNKWLPGGPVLASLVINLIILALNLSVLIPALTSGG